MSRGVVGCLLCFVTAFFRIRASLAARLLADLARSPLFRRGLLSIGICGPLSFHASYGADEVFGREEGD